MKRFRRINFPFLAVLSMLLLVTSCAETTKTNNSELALNETAKKEDSKPVAKELSEAFKKYWYAGKAEITSYEIEEARYGEIREGKAVLIYVTEPFLADKQVKADRSNPDNIPVLKLNSTKKYLTGIYPYSIMESSFYPVADNQHAVKVSGSVQEWCGQQYAQINNRERFEITSHSYFEKEADQNLSIDKAILENELWNKIRINPKNLPTGAIRVVPSLQYIRLTHKDFKAYEATAKLSEKGDLTSYSIHYPSLERTLVINFTTAFPHSIESWEETAKSGYGSRAKTLTSKGTRLKRLKTAYWGQNSNSYIRLRDSLQL